MYKILEKHFWNTFLLHVVVEAWQLVNEISSFPEVLYKRSDLKNVSKFTEKHKKQYPEVFCQKMFLKILQNSQINIFASVSFLLKLQAGNLKL